MYVGILFRHSEMVGLVDFGRLIIRKTLDQMRGALNAKQQSRKRMVNGMMKVRHLQEFHFCAAPAMTEQ